MRTGRIIRDHQTVSAGGFEILMYFLVQLRASKRGARCQSITRIFADELAVGANGSFKIVVRFRLLTDLE